MSPQEQMNLSLLKRTLERAQVDDKPVVQITREELELIFQSLENQQHRIIFLEKELRDYK